MELKFVNRLKSYCSLTSQILIQEWLPKYNRAWQVANVYAGLTLLRFVVPKEMAYASIAGLPPQVEETT